jgi:hypothetical protein
MKRFLVFLVFFQLVLFSSLVFAQTAKIIDIKGEVLIKKTADASWEKAKVNMVLGKQAEIKTENNAECTLTFDEELKNILTVKSNSQIKIENVKPVSLYLPKGRVFSLVDDIAKVEKFEVRTPTAIAGVKGSGDSVESGDDGTSSRCFDGSLYVQGLDEQGNPTGEQDLPEGYGVNVGSGGVFGDMYQLGDDDFSEWRDFSGNIEGMRGETEGDGEETESMNDLREEGRDDFGDSNFQENRQNEEQGAPGTTEERSSPEKVDTLKSWW